jgi:hypothetical protein
LVARPQASRMETFKFLWDGVTLSFSLKVLGIKVWRQSASQSIEVHVNISFFFFFHKF